MLRVDEFIDGRAAPESKAEIAARMEAQGRKAQEKAQQQYEKIVAADPTTFQFDEVYDSIQKEKGIEQPMQNGVKVSNSSELWGIRNY